MRKIYYKSGFTLAEMMVVMLILTIILAAFAPLMTKRKAVDLSNPWRYATNNSDIYYGMGATQTAMIGQLTKPTADKNSKLTINTNSDSQLQILFKSRNISTVGILADSASNLLFGSSSYSDLSGSKNVAYGSSSLDRISSGYNNTAIGYNSMGNLSTGNNNTAIGYNTLRSNTSGRNNTAIGYNASYYTATGSNNTAIGYNACENVTGSNKTCIGINSGPNYGNPEATNSKEVVYLGSTNSTVYIPGNLVVGGRTWARGDTVVNGRFASQNRTFLGNESEGGGNILIWSLYRGDNGDYREAELNNFDLPDEMTSFAPPIDLSDKRLKNVGKPYAAGLEELKKLNLYNYTFKNDKEKTPRVGVMAQDLQNVFPDAISKMRDGFLGIRKEDMFYAMINAIKQLDISVQNLITEVKTLEAKLDTFINKENLQEKRIQELERRLKLLEK